MKNLEIFLISIGIGLITTAAIAAMACLGGLAFQYVWNSAAGYYDKLPVFTFGESIGISMFLSGCVRIVVSMWKRGDV
jgi:hypothetical protein